jgi:hypothetical protein
MKEIYAPQICHEISRVFTNPFNFVSFKNGTYSPIQPILEQLVYRTVMKQRHEKQ